MNKEIFYNEEAWLEKWNKDFNRKDRERCTRCLFDITTPSIILDKSGICIYCKTHDQLSNEYPSGSPFLLFLGIVVTGGFLTARPAPSTPTSITAKGS